MKKKFDLFSGIRTLLNPQQWSDIYQAKSEENKKNEKKIQKSEKGLKKGPKVRGKHISQTAKQDKKLLLAQAKIIKKLNPNINRKKIAYELAEFSKKYEKVGLSKTFSESYIYQYILKKSS